MDKPEILELDSRGRGSYYIGAAFHAVGSGKVYAYGARAALARVNVNGLEPARKAAIVMDCVCTGVEGCARPVNWVRVTADGVEHIEIEKLLDQGSNSPVTTETE